MNGELTSGTADFTGGLSTDVVDIFAPGLEDQATPLQPRVRIREEHNISRRDIDPYALKVLYRLARHNFIAYLVGGGVRDLLLGRQPKDFDISTNARPEQIRALFRNCILIGRRFRLAHIRYGDKIIETSTFRRTPESSADPTDPEADLFQRDDNLFGSPQEDALRRDFTVNGLFYDIETFSIIDYVGGMEDLAERRIRCIGDPCIRFREDPVRMVRAVRFASRLDFSIHPDTLDAIRKHCGELAKASPPRLLEEITRLFAFSSGEKAVRLLLDTGLLETIMPEVVESLRDDDAGMLWKRLQALDEGDTVLPDATPALIFATLLLGPLKRRMERDWAADEFPRLKFDKVHAFLEPLAQRLRFPRKLVDRIVHMYLAQSRFASPGGKRGSIANFVTQDSFHESLAMAEILHTAEGLSQNRLNQWRDLLTERIYGRDEGGSDERRRSGQDNGGGKREVAGEEPAQGAKLSRSARRRRNRRVKRQREQGQVQAANGEAAAETPAEPQAATVEAPVKTAPEAPVSSASAAEAPLREQKSARQSRPRRSRGGKAKESAGENDGKSRQAKSAKEARQPAQAPAETILEVVKPLTAQSFYAPAPEPEEEQEPKKKTSTRKPRAQAQRKTKKAEKEASGSAAEAAQEQPRPLQMDRADEADIPMHWLDEI